MQVSYSQKKAKTLVQFVEYFQSLAAFVDDPKKHEYTDSPAVSAAASLLGCADEQMENLLIGVQDLLTIFAAQLVRGGVSEGQVLSVAHALKMSISQVLYLRTAKGRILRALVSCEEAENVAGSTGIFMRVDANNMRFERSIFTVWGVIDAISALASQATSQLVLAQMCGAIVIADENAKSLRDDCKKEDGYSIDLALFASNLADLHAEALEYAFYDVVGKSPALAMIQQASEQSELGAQVGDYSGQGSSVAAHVQQTVKTLISCSGGLGAAGQQQFFRQTAQALQALAGC